VPAPLVERRRWGPRRPCARGGLEASGGAVTGVVQAPAFATTRNRIWRLRKIRTKNACEAHSALALGRAPFGMRGACPFRPRESHKGMRAMRTAVTARVVGIFGLGLGYPFCAERAEAALVGTYTLVQDASGTETDNIVCTLSTPDPQDPPLDVFGTPVDLSTVGAILCIREVAGGVEQSFHCESSVSGAFVADLTSGTSVCLDPPRSVCLHATVAGPERGAARDRGKPGVQRLRTADRIDGVRNRGARGQLRGDRRRQRSADVAEDRRTLEQTSRRRRARRSSIRSLSKRFPSPSR
jgi:hypothetical protein